jgi:hypothetical protein
MDWHHFGHKEVKFFHPNLFIFTLHSVPLKQLDFQQNGAQLQFISSPEILCFKMK